LSNQPNEVSEELSLNVIPKIDGLPISRLKMPAASLPSLLRSAPAWSEIMKRPPPFCTKLRMAVISVEANAMFGSGMTKTL